jgi:hypothetical protein
VNSSVPKLKGAKRFTGNSSTNAQPAPLIRSSALYDKPATLLEAYALLNRIRLCASDAVLAEAERTLHVIAEQYFSPNLSVEELRTVIRSRDQDPLKPFGEACRRELKTMRTAV